MRCANSPWKNTALSGKDLKRSSVQFDPTTGAPIPIFGHGGARATAEKMGAPFLGEIPIDIALREAYGPAMSRGQYPATFVFLTLPPEEVDPRFAPDPTDPPHPGA
jgi:hypothetical protein